jgi:hypothetical protein
MLASADGRLDASLSLLLEPGTYYIVVASQGNYGDVGQYSASAVISAANLIVLNTASCRSMARRGATQRAW